MKWVLCAVALVALLVMGARAARVGLAGDDLDPVGRISAQDEALYAHSAIRMAEQGGWLTPMFLGRFGLYKPPLLMWMSGVSARILGVSTFSLRLPAVFASCIVVCLVFLWVTDIRSRLAAAAAAGLLLSNHLWFVVGSMCLTDGLLACSIVTAVYVLYRDPQLRTTASFIGLGLAIGAGVLAKSAAGLLPLGILVVYWMLAPQTSRPPIRRTALTVLLASAVAAPWFLYQAAVHPRWFLAEHVGLELVAYGTRTPPQTSTESQAGFYLVRQFLLDPVLSLLVLAAVPGFVSAVRRRVPSALLLLAWILVVAASVLAWRYRNLSYLLPLAPALAIAAAGYGPLFRPGSMPKCTIALLAVVFGIKVANPSQQWGLSFAAGTKLEVAPVLARYCELERGNDLIQLGMNDALYATVLPVGQVRYAFVGSPGPAGEYALDFARMGIVLTASEFGDLKAAKQRSLPRLREWGLDSTEPVGTVILAASTEDLLGMIKSHPESDFLLSDEYREKVRAVAAATHETVEGVEGRFLLLSKTMHKRVTTRGCRL